jgi:AGCS family alanine or glycine:cation symporter
MLFVSFIFVGAVVKLNLVWNFADAMNGLMALPNLIGLLLLSPIIASETRRYLYEMRQNRTSRDLPQ